jgi:hypothetical protein
MRKLMVRLGAVIVVLVAAGVAAGASYRGVVPTVISGNPGCSEVPNLSFSTQVKFSPPVDGASAAGVHLTQNGNSVGWYTLGDILVKAVLVKGGTSANLYRYPATDDYSDGTLFAPTNPKNGKPYDPSTITVCY